MPLALRALVIPASSAGTQRHGQSRRNLPPRPRTPPERTPPLFSLLTSPASRLAQPSPCSCCTSCGSCSPPGHSPSASRLRFLPCVGTGPNAPSPGSGVSWNKLLFARKPPSPPLRRSHPLPCRLPRSRPRPRLLATLTSLSSLLRHHPPPAPSAPATPSLKPPRPAEKSGPSCLWPARPLWGRAGQRQLPLYPPLPPRHRMPFPEPRSPTLVHTPRQLPAQTARAATPTPAPLP